MINHDSFNLNGYKYIGTNRSKRRGGGVGMYISKQLSFKICDDLAQNIEDVIESTFIEINKTTGKNIIIGLVYHPPNNKFEIFENAINTTFTKLKEKTKYVTSQVITILICLNRNLVIFQIDLLNSYLLHLFFL